ncbi:hypothetical protein ACMD2_23063, partial [Ananas comosus]
MSTTNFIALRDVLLARGLIRATRRMTTDEQLAIFLFCVGHGVENRVLAEIFQHSGETISRHFNNVLRALVTLKDEYMNLPPSNAALHPRIRDNINFHPFKKRFKILTQATPFSIKVQCLIPMACCVLHNFIRRQQENDRYFVEQLELETPEGDVGDPEPIPSRGDDSTRGESLRRSITDQLWNNRS